MITSQLNDPVIAIGIPVAAVILAYQRKLLTTDGCIAALVIGIIITLESFQHSITLLTFFFVGSICTKFKQKRKAKFIPWESNNDTGRDYTQVLSNGLIPTLLVLCHPVYLSLLSPDTVHYVYNIYISVALGDTLSSELGMLAETEPINIVTGETTQPGTDGAITLLGVNAAALGGVIVSGIDTYFNGFNSIPFQNNAIYGTVGSVIDSIIGAIYQAKLVGEMREMKQIDPRAAVLHKQLNNICNVVSSIVTCLLAYYMKRQYLDAGIHADIALFVIMWLLLTRRIPFKASLASVWNAKSTKTATVEPKTKSNKKSKKNR